MRSAPAVSVVCAGGRPWRALHALPVGAAAAALVAWALAALELPTWPAIVVGALAAAAVWRFMPQSLHRLEWDGQRWHADGTPGRLAVMLDLGSWLLLRLQPDADPTAVPRPSGTLWLPVAASEAGGGAWHLLRAAAFASTSTPA
jgi:hypothetical protein